MHAAKSSHRELLAVGSDQQLKEVDAGISGPPNSLRMKKCLNLSWGTHPLINHVLLMGIGSNRRRPGGLSLTTPECSARVFSHLSVDTAIRRKPLAVCCWDA